MRVLDFRPALPLDDLDGFLPSTPSILMADVDGIVMVPVVVVVVAFVVTAVCPPPLFNSLIVVLEDDCIVDS